MSRKGTFRPDEVLFALTGACNLRCGHCDALPGASRLSRRDALRFLAGCRAAGIRRVGFTGGEPFLAHGCLCALVRKSVAAGLVFDRIMTNGVWWNGRAALTRALGRLAAAGYDGSIAVSVDAFHRQDLRKVAAFIETVTAIWRRPDMVSLVFVRGARDRGTADRLRRCARLLGGKVTGEGDHRAIRARDLFCKLIPVDLVPVGRARRLSAPWDGRWFREDFCGGPGHVLYVLPDGEVKPCCGYATASDMLTIGNIRRDTPAGVIGSARENPFVRTVFGSGLSAVRRRLEEMGARFPGKTSNHCYFCSYLLTRIPEDLLRGCLDR